MKLTDDAIEFLYGCLLGDGSVVPHRSRAYYGQASKHIEYLQWIERQLATFGIQRTGTKIYRRRHEHNSNVYFSYQYISRSYSELVEIRNKWYSPNCGKQPPPDLRLTPLMLRQWFLDDGHFRQPKWKPHQNGKLYWRRGNVRLCNRSFVPDSKLFLVNQLQSFGLDATIHPDVIYIPVKYTKRFFDIIGPCPLPSSFGYKWPQL